MPLIEFELNLLRSMNGEDVPGLAWGAAMSEALGSLRGGGYVRQEFTERGVEYKITDKGREAIK